jgi:hypothetical protein
MSVQNFIQKLKESESYKKFRDEMNEMSTTGMVAGYDTPKAFAPQDGEGKEKFDAQTKDNAEQFGYKLAKKEKRRHSISKEEYAKQESTYKQAMKSLHEASYKEYKGDKTRTTGEKINNSIKELNQSLLRVERAVGHALRLKTEMAVDQRSLWRSSHNRLVKIGERLNRIGKKINELGA